MPYSDDCFDRLAQAVIKSISPQRCIDLGAGAGKYGKLIRAACPAAHVTAVEVERSYIAEFGLDEIYNEVRCINCVDIISSDIDETWDLVIIGDAIEHLRKSHGVDLLNFLVYRTRYILVLYPSEYIQNTVEGKSSEAHISVWCESDFAPFLHSQIQMRGPQNFVIIAGYLNPRSTQKEIDALAALNLDC